MSRFFQQLVARQQGQADTVQPLIAPRFAQPTSHVVNLASPENSIKESSILENSILENSISEPSAQQSSATQPEVNVNHSYVAGIESNAFSFQSQHPSTTFSTAHSSPSAVNQTASPVTNTSDVATRLAQVAQWMGSLSAAVDVSQEVSQFDRVDAVESVDNRQQNDGSEQPQLDPFSNSAIQPHDTQSLEAPHPQSSQSAQPLVTSSQTITTQEPTVSPSQITTPNQAVASTRLAEHLKPISKSLSPVSLQHSLQPPLPIPQRPAPTIQVAIGRIEIRASQPATPAPRPRRVTSPKRAAMSLEQYLQRRRKGGTDG